MKKREYTIAALLFFLITAVFFYKMFLYNSVPFPGDLLVAVYSPWKTYSYFGYSPGTYPNKAQFFDTLRQLYPWKTFALQQIKQGIFPLWNPHNFSGSPLFANFQSAILYPFNFLYYFLPQMTAWSVLTFLQPFFSGFFTYLYGRKIKLSFFGALLAGISYGFSSFMVVWLEYNTIDKVILWLPLLLLLLECIYEEQSVLLDVLFIFTAISIVFAGHPQIAGYLFLFAFFYAFFRKIINRHIALLSFFSFGIAAIQVVPGIELLHYAARSAHTYAEITQKILIQPWQVVMLLIPDFFGNPATGNYVLNDTYIGNVMSIGIVPLFFASLLLVNWRKVQSYVKFYGFACIIIFTFITLNPLTAFIYLFQLPFISSSGSNLMVFLFCFSLSILAGYGFDSFLRNAITKRKFFIVSSLWIVTFVVIALIAYAVPFRVIALRNTLYEFLFLLMGVLLVGLIRFFPRVKIYAILFLLFLIIVNSWRDFQKFVPFVPRQLVFPDTPVLSYVKNISGIQRVWGMGNAEIEANFATQVGLYSPDGYDPLYPRWYGEFIQASKDGKIHTAFTGQTRSDAVIAPSSANDFSQNAFRKKIVNLLGVAYILDRMENLSTEETFPVQDYPLIYNQDNWKMYRNAQALPRFFLVNKTQNYTSPEQFGKIFFDTHFNPRTTILLEKKNVYREKKTMATDMSVTVRSYTSRSISFFTKTNGPAFLFLSDTYYPGWKAYIDNKKTDVLKADYAFRAVIVPSGVHRVTFIFQSLSFQLGLVISVLSIIGAIGYCLGFHSAERVNNRKDL